MKTIFLDGKEYEVTDEYFDYLFCEQAKCKELKVVDGKVVAQEIVITDAQKAQTRIDDLKQKLSETDYHALKYFEGELTQEEFEPIRLQRKTWREEIRELGG